MLINILSYHTVSSPRLSTEEPNTKGLQKERRKRFDRRNRGTQTFKEGRIEERIKVEPHHHQLLFYSLFFIFYNTTRFAFSFFFSFFFRLGYFLDCYHFRTTTLICFLEILYIFLVVCVINKKRETNQLVSTEEWY